MSRQAEILAALRTLTYESRVQVFRAEVVAVDVTTCTVRLDTGLEIDEVRLVATPKETATDCLLVKPVVGSFVLVGLLNNDLATLYVVSYDAVAELRYEIGESLIEANNDHVRVVCNQMEVELLQAKIAIRNATVSLKDLYADLVDILNTLKVITPQGPSTAVDPTSLTKIAALNTKINQLLQ